MRNYLRNLRHGLTGIIFVAAAVAAPAVAGAQFPTSCNDPRVVQAERATYAVKGTGVEFKNIATRRVNIDGRNGTQKALWCRVRVTAYPMPPVVLEFDIWLTASGNIRVRWPEGNNANPGSSY